MTSTWFQRIPTAGSVAAENIIINVKWTVATRPTGSALEAGTRGFNTDFDGYEHYNGTAWFIESGTWTTSTRPDSSLIAAGSRGENTDIGQTEEWNGTVWIT